ncbi:MAG: zinc transporter ZupT [Candidatus Hodarchaeota archaeon]
METFVFALILALLAGLSTTVGCIIAFLVKKPSPEFLSIIMGFSAGVMILVSFVELLIEGININGFIMGIIFFFVGLFMMLLVDMTVTHKYEFEDTFKILYDENLEKNENSLPPSTRRRRRRYRYGREKTEVNLEKTSLLVFLGVFIHNIPEGIATFIGTIQSIELGIILAVAIALHNIPEGIAVATPIYISTESRKKAFLWSFLSGISEFIGAVVFGLILYPFINNYLLGAMLAIVAGLMVYISLDELLPVSHSLGREHLSILGLIMGMLVMSLSLVLFLK